MRIIKKEREKTAQISNWDSWLSAWVENRRPDDKTILIHCWYSMVCLDRFVHLAGAQSMVPFPRLPQSIWWFFGICERERERERWVKWVNKSIYIYNDTSKLEVSKSGASKKRASRTEKSLISRWSVCLGVRKAFNELIYKHIRINLDNSTSDAWAACTDIRVVMFRCYGHNIG